MVHLSVTMYCNWSTDHSSIGLKRLTIQLVFNKVSLFTFSQGTHGFDVTAPKNYLKKNFTDTFVDFSPESSYSCVTVLRCDWNQTKA